MTNQVKITESILSEIDHQCDRQSEKNYRGVEVDYRTLKALIAEIRRGRLVDLRFERPTEPAMRD